MSVEARAPQVHKIDSALDRIVVTADGTSVEPPAQGIGSTARRHDGDEKATGAAIYAGEETPAGTLHGVMVMSPVAKGTLKGIDASGALAGKGVVRVVTRADMPEIGAPAVPPAAQSFMPMTDDTIRYEGQPLAIVLAETLEQAEAGAALVKLDIAREAPTVFETAEAVEPRTENNGYAFAPIDVAHGDVSTAMAEAAATTEGTYVAPTRHHNMMEPSATLAEWRGDELHTHDSTQWTFGIRYAVSGLLGMEPAKIHARCPYTGGGFGAKGYVWPHQVLAPIAAKLTGRPVKIAIGREGCYTDTGYQPVVVSRVALGADADGKLVAIEHHTENVSSRFDDYVEFGSAGTRGMYNVEGAKPAYAMTTRIRHADVATPTAMRAPHEGPGMFALESEMDELALKLDMDPLELRLANYAETDLHSGKPFSSKKLREAYAEGARRIGWERRGAPRSRREGTKLVGLGMASAIMSTFRFAATARCALNADGTVEIEVGSQEIGTGTRTIFAQIAAERLGIPADRISVTLGSTALPETGGTFGSSSTISVGSAVADAADKLKERIAALDASTGPDGWADMLRSKGVNRLQADGGFTLPGETPFDAQGGQSDYSMHTYGATFVEMEVDEGLGIARMRRCVACYSAGRILNPVTARSQMIGGIIWGYGRAMLEESAMDRRYARYLSKNLSGVHLPVNADIPQDIDVAFIEENDPHASAIGVRGIGELGEVGVAAAITNAIHNATGKRIRELPVKFDKLIG